MITWRDISTAPESGTVILTNEGTAIYVNPAHWGSPVKRGWYLCTAGGDIPSCQDYGMEISEIDPVRWMYIPELQS